MNKIKLSVVSSILLTSNLYAKTLEPITVYSASKAEQSIQDVTASIDVITADELETKHITNLLDAINQLSGVSFSRDGGLGQATKVNIRGMHQTNTLVLIDGIKFNDPTNANGVSFEFLDISNVERIEVIKGAQSGVWGADASGGVINIITKKAISEETTSKINLEYGSFNTQKYGLVLNQTNKKSYATLAINRTKTDGYSAQVPKDKNLADYEDDSFTNTTYNINFGSNVTSKNSIDFTIKAINSKGDFDGYLAPDDETQKYSSKNFISGVNYNHKTDDYSLDLYGNKTTFKREYPNSFTKEYKGVIDQFGFKSMLDYNQKDFIIVGAEKTISKDKVLEKSYSNKALFITNTNKINNTIVTASLRKDNNDKFENKTTGKLGIKQNIISDLSLSANYGTAYKAPTINQLYTPFYGNKDLKPESTKAYDINLQFKDLQVSYFENKVEDLISFHPTTYQNINIDGESQIKGYEVSYKKALESLLFGFNYTRTKATDKDGFRLGRIPSQTVKFSLDYFVNEKLALNLNGEYIGHRWDRNYGDHDFNSLTPKDNGEQTGKYSVFNSVLDYQYSQMMNFYLKVDNLMDKKYQVIDGYSTSPRAYYVGLNAKF